MYGRQTRASLLLRRARRSSTNAKRGSASNELQHGSFHDKLPTHLLSHVLGLTRVPDMSAGSLVNVLD